MLLVHPKNHQDQLWATEQALKSGTCSAVLSWPIRIIFAMPTCVACSLLRVRSRTLVVLFRPEAATVATASPAELRLLIESWDEDAGTLGLRVLKRRGGWPTEGIGIEFEDALTRHAGWSGPVCGLRQLAMWKPNRGAPHPVSALHPVANRPVYCAPRPPGGAGRRSAPERDAPGREDHAAAQSTVTPFRH